MTLSFMLHHVVSALAAPLDRIRSVPSIHRSASTGGLVGRSHWLEQLLIACAMTNLLVAGQLGALTYTDDGTSVTITHCSRDAIGAIEIPASINGLPVTGIGNSVRIVEDSVFYGCTGLTSISIPPGVTTIGSAAFVGCASLTSVNIPNGVTSIGPAAFAGCIGLTFMNLPDGITQIEDATFLGCSNLTLLILPESLTGIGSGAFTDCENLVALTIPTGVTSLGKKAFSGCSALTTIEVETGNQHFVAIDGVLFNLDQSGLLHYPAAKLGPFLLPSITRIDDDAFLDCHGLNEITIPASVTSIGNSAFNGCSGLTQATFLGDAPSCGYRIFSAVGSGFRSYHRIGAAGFTCPNWQDYPAFTIREPGELGRWPGYLRASGYDGFHCDVAGDIACLTTGEGGLILLDVSDPGAPVRLSGIQPDWLYGVEIRDGIAYCAGMNGLSIVDVSTPTAPTLIKHLKIGRIKRVAVEENLLCAAGADLMVIDITNLAEPELLTTFDTPEPATDVALTGGHALVALGSVGSERAGVQVIDLTDPASPVLEWEYLEEGYVGALSGCQIHVDRDRAYFGGRSEVWILDISDPALPVLAGRISGSIVFDVSAKGDYAYVASHNGGLAVYEVSDPSEPLLVRRVYPTTYTCSVALAGNICFAGDLYDGLHAIDITAPESAHQVGHYFEVGPTHEVEIVDSHAYVADGWSGFRILDISNPSHITECSSVLVRDAKAIEVVDDLAYIAGGRHGGLWIFDVSDPKAPRQVGYNWSREQGNDLLVFNGFVYIAKGFCSGISGVRILDVNDPASPEIVAIYETEDHVYNVAIKDGHLLVPNGGELDVVDISDPRNLGLIGRTDFGSGITRVCVEGDFAYCGVGYHGTSFAVVDLSVPENPQVAGTVSGGAGIGNISCFDKHLYRCGSAIEVFDIENPREPSLLAQLDTPEPESVTVDHDFMSFACWGDGVVVHAAPFRTKALETRMTRTPEGPVLDLLHTTIGAAYQVQSSPDLSVWSDDAVVNGNGHTVRRDVPAHSGTGNRLFFRALETETAETP